MCTPLERPRRFGSGFEEDLSRLEIAFTRRKHQRRQTAAAAAHEAGHDDLGVVVIVWIGRLLRRRLTARGRASTTVLAGSPGTLSASALTCRRGLSGWCGLGLSRRRRRSREATGN